MISYAFLTFILILLILLYAIKRKLYFNSEDKVFLNRNDIYIRRFNTKYFNSIQVNIVPDVGQSTCELFYSIAEDSKKILQCRWISKASQTSTNTFVNDVLGNFYELKVSPKNETNVYIGIKNVKTNIYTNPYNSEIAPINAVQTKSIELVSNGSYSVNEKSEIYDFGEMNGANIEIIASVSNVTNPRLSIFGSVVNELSKFIRIKEITFEDGTASSLNQKLYINSIEKTNLRYFYIQVTDETATDLNVTLIRKTY